MIRLRLVLGIVLGWITALNCFAIAPVWRWSNPTPHGAHIFALASKGSTIVQVGEYGQAYTSDDLEMWRPLATGVTNMLRSAVWFGPRLIITGSEGLVLYSDNLNFFFPINLGTSDWLEGVASSGSRLTAVGDNGGIYTSTDGTTWQRLTDAAEWLRSVAYGNGVFVAVGDAGYVTKSDDGLEWTAQNRLTTKDLNRVVFSGDRFWILGNEGAAFQSTTGTSWTPIDAGTTNDLFSAAYNGSDAVIVGRSELRTSSGSLDTWTSRTGDSPAPAPWTYYAAIWDGVQFLVGGRSGMFVEGFRPSGSSDLAWVSDSESSRNWLWASQRVGGVYIAAGEHGGIFTSVDGFRFDQEIVPAPATQEILEGLGGTSNVVVAVGTAGTILWSEGGFTNLVSTNSVGDLVTNQVNLLGLIWNQAASPTTNELQGVGVLGSTLIVTGGAGTILTADDPHLWLPRSSGVSVMLSSVATSPTRAVVTGDLGTVLTSDDGLVWSKRTSGVTNWIYQVRYLNGQFVAVGEDGLILTSPAGVVWTRRTSGTTRWLNGVTFESGNYYAVGSVGSVLQSPDAVTWTVLPPRTGKSLYDISGESGQLVTVGLEGAAMRARVIPWTTPVNFLALDLQTNTQAFLFSGEMDQRFILQRSLDLRRWVDIAPAEILDNSGSSLFYDAIIAGAQWFFRTVALPQ
jgi:hypothetical protein